MIDYPSKKDVSHLRNVQQLAAPPTIAFQGSFLAPTLFQAACPDPFWSIIKPASCQCPHTGAQHHPACPRTPDSIGVVASAWCLGCDE